MAKFRTCFGWEVGAARGIQVGGTTSFVNNSASARTGCYYGKCVGSNNGVFSIIEIEPNIQLASSGDDEYIVRFRFAFRIETAFTNNDVDGFFVASQVIGGASRRTGLYIQFNSTQRWRVLNFAYLTSAPTDYSNDPLNVGEWYIAEGFYHVIRSASNNRTLIVSATINGQTLSRQVGPFSANPLNQQLSIHGINFGYLTPGGNGDLNFDDAIIAAGSGSDSGIQLPTSTRVRLIPINEEVSNDWTGDFSDLKNIPVPTGGTPGLSTSTIGATCTFNLPPQSSFGVPSLQIKDIEMLKVYAYCRSNSGATSDDEAIILNGVEYIVRVTDQQIGDQLGIVNVHRANEIPEIVIPLNTIEVGFRNKTGRVLLLGGLHMEAVCELSTALQNGCGLVTVDGNPHSGLYTVVKGQKFDRLYDWPIEDFEDVKIPNPKIKTGLL